MNKSSVIERRRKEILRSSIQKVTDDQQINWADVKSKVQQGDITYTLAVTIAQRKIEGIQTTSPRANPYAFRIGRYSDK